jgi:hypothetical protein
VPAGLVNELYVGMRRTKELGLTEVFPICSSETIGTEEEILQPIWEQGKKA